MEGAPAGSEEDPSIPVDPASAIMEGLEVPPSPTLDMKVASRTAPKARQTVEGAPASYEGDPNIPADPALTTTEELEVPMYTTLAVEELRNMTRNARILLHAGLLFAVHQEEEQEEQETEQEDEEEQKQKQEQEQEQKKEQEEKQEKPIRYARFKIHDGRLYLHYLQDELPPPGAFIVEMNEVVPDAFPCLVFLDMEWPGSAPRRILIRLYPKTPRGQQFLLMCTGQRGPCHVNTTLWEVLNKDLPDECVSGGDYENNDGTEGAALLPELDQFEYDASSKAGAVWGWWDDPTEGAQYGINTRDREIGGSPDTFGHIVEGLEVVMEAAQHDPITEVTVVDCGVVLWE